MDGNLSIGELDQLEAAASEMMTIAKTQGSEDVDVLPARVQTMFDIIHSHNQMGTMRLCTHITHRGPQPVFFVCYDLTIGLCKNCTQAYVNEAIALGKSKCYWCKKNKVSVFETFATFITGVLVPVCEGCMHDAIDEPSA